MLGQLFSPAFFFVSIYVVGLSLCEPCVFGNKVQEMFHQVLLINASPHAGFNGESLKVAQEPLSRASKQCYLGRVWLFHMRRLEN